MEKNVFDDNQLDEVSGGLRGTLAMNELFNDLPVLANLSEAALARLALANDDNELITLLAKEGINNLAANELATIRRVLRARR